MTQRRRRNVFEPPVRRRLLSYLTVTVFASVGFFASPKSTDSKTLPKELSRRELRVLQSLKGIYDAEGERQPFVNTVLVTAVNHAWYDFYQNWAYFARRAGLKWVTVALDSEVYKKVGAERSILSDRHGYILPQDSQYREKNYNVIVCDKLRQVIRLAYHGRVDVIFSDSDNVFIRDPFTTSSSLGYMIRLHLYDYIYQHNGSPATVGNSNPTDGNTGFYYVTTRRSPEAMKALFVSTLEKCTIHPELDDQTLFWQTMDELRTGKLHQTWRTSSLKSRPEPFQNALFCPGEVPSSLSTLAYCPLKPQDHPVGAHKNLTSMYTFHANYMIGKLRKVDRLCRLDLWRMEGCNVSSNEPNA